MQRHVFAAAVLIFIMSFTVGGFTAAYFTDEAFLPLAEFTTGTVDIDLEVKENHSEIEETNYGYEGTVKWRIKNIGTKKAYLRARLNWELDGEGGGEYGGGETAWAVGYDVINKNQKDASSPRFGGGNARYHVYTLGHTEGNPLQLKLGEGANYIDGGTAYIWDDGEKLYVEARTKNDRRFMETHLYVGSVAPENHAPGLLGYKHEGIYGKSDRYEVDLPGGIQDEKVYIALHAVIQKLISGGDTAEMDFDVKGDWVEGEGGYYYYEEVVEPGASAYFEVEFEVEVDGAWSGSCSFWLEDVEAVQASHGAIHEVWPNNPWNN